MTQFLLPEGVGFRRLFQLWHLRKVIADLTTLPAGVVLSFWHPVIYTQDACFGAACRVGGLWCVRCGGGVLAQY